MRILITGAAGFVGSSLVKFFFKTDKQIKLFGIDNFSRKGSETNFKTLEDCKVVFFKGDIANQKDIDELPDVDWIIDCAADPSVLAGRGSSDSLTLINNNLIGTICLLEKCKRDKAGFILVSTNRVYSIPKLNELDFEEADTRFTLKNYIHVNGVTSLGVAESFSTNSPISLYGATKLASEILALEYSYAFGFPVWINRCGVIAGQGQFGKIDQGIFSFWVYQYLLNRPLSFIGFKGSGKQVRDMLHPFDLFSLINKQINNQQQLDEKIFNLGGGISNIMSLLELDMLCKKNIGKKNVLSDPITRPYDIPYYATDYSLAKKIWDWEPTIGKEAIIDQIISFGSDNLDHIRAIS